MKTLGTRTPIGASGIKTPMTPLNLYVDMESVTILHYNQITIWVLKCHSIIYILYILEYYLAKCAFEKSKSDKG